MTGAPLVYGPSGAVLGIDFRRTELVPDEFRVPGTVPARVVMPGDSIWLFGERVVVHSVAAGHPGHRAFHCRDALGHEVVWAGAEDDYRVQVLAVGAFEPVVSS